LNVTARAWASGKKISRKRLEICALLVDVQTVDVEDSKDGAGHIRIGIGVDTIHLSCLFTFASSVPGNVCAPQFC
jgi:hypothetical protein